MAYPGNNDDPSTGAGEGAPSGANGGIRDAAQQIWLAGLGAFAKAQQEGSKVFESLVREGARNQRQAQESAPASPSEAAARMAGFASDFGNRAAGQWDRLEEMFEARVSKALGHLGVPTARDLAALEERVAALEKQLLAQGRRPPGG